MGLPSRQSKDVHHQEIRCLLCPDSCHHTSLEATETAVAAQEVLVTSRSTSPALRVRTIPSTPRSHRPDLTATEEWREATMLTLRLSARPSIFVPTMERAEG